LFTNVGPASTVAQVEIFGPVLASMSFRTPDEAVALANNTRYGLAASIWSEDINLALDVATRVKAGTVWINSTNLFDAASGFGGYKESGFGREGGREGLWEYVRGIGESGSRVIGKSGNRRGRTATNGHVRGDGLPPVDRTAKMFIGGKQVRPDGGYSIAVHGPDKRLVGEVGRGNRKDIRNAVEAARSAAPGWAATTGHARGQILYFLAENLAARAGEFAGRLSAQTGADGSDEVQATVEALFSAAAWSDKYDGLIHDTPIRNVTLAIPEPLGVMAILAPDDQPLLTIGALVAHAVAMGNTVVVVPSPAAPLSATDFYQVIETSDVPAGVINIVTGERDELATTLAEHDDVDGIWYAGPKAGRAAVEAASAGNMKRTWVHPPAGPLPSASEVLRHATQVKNIWVPYGA
jgi:aldehyde dehydrogenase (NAD+)